MQGEGFPMRRYRLVVGTALFLLPLVAADKKAPPEPRASNAAVEITARANLEKVAIRQALGAELEAGFVVLEVRVAPQGGKKLLVTRDDFTLLSSKDGQKCGAFAPSQIAGSGVLVVSTSGRGGGLAAENGGPAWGGVFGRPSRMPGEGAAIGNTSQGEAQASVQATQHDKENPLLAALKQKALPEKETEQPLSGLLYFFLEGKHKLKDLELLYRGPAGKLSLSFQP